MREKNVEGVHINGPGHNLENLKNLTIEKVFNLVQCGLIYLKQNTRDLMQGSEKFHLGSEIYLLYAMTSLCLNADIFLIKIYYLPHVQLDYSLVGIALSCKA
jgi:hypothetical protein